MNQSAHAKRLSVIMVADIVGYSRLIEQDTDGTVAVRSNLPTMIDSHIPPAATVAGRPSDGDVGGKGFFDQGNITNVSGKVERKINQLQFSLDIFFV